MLWLGPFLTYANFLQRTRNRTVLLDVGLGIAFPGFPTDNVSAAGVAAQRSDWLGSHRFHTELEAEKFLHAATAFIRKRKRTCKSGFHICVSEPMVRILKGCLFAAGEMQGGPQSSDPNDIPGAMHTWCFDRPAGAPVEGEGICTRGRRGPFNKFAFFEHQNYVGVSG